MKWSVRVTVHCQPIVAGKGRLLIAGFGDVAGSHFYIEAPVIDTVDRLVDSSTSDVAQAPFSFTTTEPCVRTWVLRFSHPATYRIRAWAVIDSVFVQDSLRFYPPESQVARRHYGVPEGMDWDMSTNFLEYYIYPWQTADVDSV